MIRSVLTEAGSRESLLIYRGHDSQPVLVTTEHIRYAGTFNTVSRTTAGTSTLANIYADEAVGLTDLIVTTDKVNGGVVTVQFTDGTNTAVILSARVTDAPCNLAINFSGTWEGWKNARIDLVVTGNVNVTVALGYCKIPETSSQAYDAWLLRR